MLKKVDVAEDFGALWEKDNLIGLYILKNEYMHTIAVDPKYENKGYGSKIVKYCLKNMFFNKKYNEIYLHVYFENKKAQKLYIKNGFEVRGFYCENTYQS